jgi:hypothetical protein
MWDVLKNPVRDYSSVEEKTKSTFLHAVRYANNKVKTI